MLYISLLFSIGSFILFSYSIFLTSKTITMTVEADEKLKAINEKMNQLDKSVIKDLINNGKKINTVNVFNGDN